MVKHLITATVISALICLAGCEADVNMVDFGKNSEEAAVARNPYLGSWVGDNGALIIRLEEQSSDELWDWAGGEAHWHRRGSYELDGNQYKGHGVLGDGTPETFYIVFSSETSGEAWLASEHPTHVTIQKQ